MRHPCVLQCGGVRPIVGKDLHGLHARRCHNGTGGLLGTQRRLGRRVQAVLECFVAGCEVGQGDVTWHLTPKTYNLIPQAPPTTHHHRHTIWLVLWAHVCV